jgi:hypothetical protein
VNHFVHIGAEDNQEEHDKHQQKVFLDLHRRTSFVEALLRHSPGQGTLI